MLKLYSDVQQTRLNWLWYPYIAFGKITILQGNPGNGKSHVGINLAAALSSRGTIPNGTRFPVAQKVIYQCAEDGLADTVKPRLIEAGADCRNVAFIDDETLTLDDEQIRSSIEAFDARLLIIDPFQAYLGNSDISSASGIRRILNRVSKWANLYECAVLLIGHLNKNEGARDLYRGLGSIDVAAAARSILQIDVDPDDEGIRRMHQIKNSLAPQGNDICFSITSGGSIRWIHEELSETPPEPDARPVMDYGRSKQEIAMPDSGPTRLQPGMTFARGLGTRSAPQRPLRNTGR
ncbi:MAG: AAA family ATPase [Spirochaetales bacterium]|nr:AAA family ATPase [Spirochaetales bacterium]